MANQLSTFPNKFSDSNSRSGGLNVSVDYVDGEDFCEEDLVSTYMFICFICLCICYHYCCCVEVVTSLDHSYPSGQLLVSTEVVYWSAPKKGGHKHPSADV